MEAVVLGSDSARGSSSIAATAVGNTVSIIPQEFACDMVSEKISGTESELPRPRIQYSTDLRKELSLDVLASLGDASTDESKALEDSIMDLDTMSAQMEFISDLTPLTLPPDQADPTQDNSPTSLATLPEGTSNGLGASNSPTGSDASLLASSSLTEAPKSPSGFSVDPSSYSVASPSSPHPLTTESVDASYSNAFGAALTSSMPSCMNATSAATAALMVDDYPVSSASMVVSSTHVASAREGSPFFGAVTAELSSSLPPQQFPHVALPDALPVSNPPPVSNHALASSKPLKFSSVQVAESSVADGVPHLVEAPHVTVEPISSSSVCLTVADVAPVPLDSVPVHLENFSVPLDNHPVSDAHAPKLSFKAGGLLAPVDLTSVGYSNSLAILPAELLSDEVQSLSREKSVLDTPERHSVRFEGDAARVSGGGPPMATVVHPFVASGVGTSELETLISEAFPTSASIIAPNVPLSISPQADNTLSEDLPRAVVTACASVSPPASDAVAAPLSLTPSVDLPKVLPVVPSPLATGVFWDGSSSSGPSPSSGVSLSTYFDGSRSPFRGRKSARKKKSLEGGTDGKDSKGKGLTDAEKMEDVAELEIMLAAQKKMLQWQIDEVQRITVLQCQLTGSNPLSDELVLDVIGVKGGGKKSGDVLPPEALRCLQEIFAIKDTITKKEARDISATSGASLTQVRDFFAAQRSLVRKILQQAHDEAGRLGVKNASEQSQQIAVLNSMEEKDLGFDKLSGVESVEKLMGLMRAEKGFSGQARLLQVLLHTDSTVLILRRFLEKGGLRILGRWLGEAASEEQTSLIGLLLKVLDHLPISYAAPHQMPPLVQNVNKLRFYHSSAVSGQARSLLTKWSKMFLPKVEGVKSASSPRKKLVPEPEASPTISSGVSKRNRDSATAQAVPGSRKKKVKAEVLQLEKKSSPAPVPVPPNLNGATQAASEPPSSSLLSPPVPPPPKPRWSSTLEPSESAVAAVSVSRKRLASKSLGDQPKDRRKVLLVEDSHVRKSVSPVGVSKTARVLKTSRPLSTDDIYKAKKLERLMQEPVAKSRRSAQALSDARDIALQAVVSEESPTPVSLESGKKVAILAPMPDRKNVSMEASTAVQGEQETEAVGKTDTLSRIAEQSETQRPIRPTSSQELLQTVTPTSSQEIFVPGRVTDEMSEDTAHKRDSAMTAGLDTQALVSSLMASSSHEQTAAVGPVGMPKAPVDSTCPAEELLISHAVVFEEALERIHSLQGRSSPILIEEESSTTVAEDVCMITASRAPSESKFDVKELAGLPAQSGVKSNLDKYAVEVSGAMDESSKGEDLVVGSDGNPAPRDRTLIDFYAALRASMIRWRVPPEYEPHPMWNVAAGNDSKEKEFQSGRVKREEEAYYAEPSAIPDDPKDPWEEEPSYDDSLTLEIFVDSDHRKGSVDAVKELDMSRASAPNLLPTKLDAAFKSDAPSNITQTPKDGEKLGANLSSKEHKSNQLDLVWQQLSSGGGGIHDPDLLALLLRNPDLVSQLTAEQAFTPSEIANQAVFPKPVEHLKQTISGGSGGMGLTTQVADVGKDRDRLATSNKTKAVGTSLQPGRPLSSMDQMPTENLRAQDSEQMMPHPGLGQQQALGFGPQGGMDNRFLAPQMPPVGLRNIQDSSGWEQPRIPPPPPPMPPPLGPPTQSVTNQVLQPPPMQTITNQVLQPPLPSHPNKMSNWPEPQGWAGGARPPPVPMNSPQTSLSQEQLHMRPQAVMAPNVRSPNYGGIGGVPQVEVGPAPPVVTQLDIHRSQRPWLNGSHLGAALHDNATTMQTTQESGVGRSNRWPRAPAGPVDNVLRLGVSRGFPEFNVRQANVVDNRPVWLPSDRSRPGLLQFQGAFGLPPLPPPPQYPVPLWQGQEGNVRPAQAGVVPQCPHGRDLRPPQQQLWHNNMGPGRQMWRGP